jgi:hypothetical protein
MALSFPFPLFRMTILRYQMPPNPLLQRLTRDIWPGFLWRRTLSVSVRDTQKQREGLRGLLVQGSPQL